MKPKKTFKIAKITKGFFTFWGPQVKTWIGWKFFYASDGNGEIYFMDENISPRKGFAAEQIETYRKIKGLKPEEIQIIDEN